MRLRGVISLAVAVLAIVGILGGLLVSSADIESAELVPNQGSTIYGAYPRQTVEAVQDGKRTQAVVEAEFSIPSDGDTQGTISVQIMKSQRRQELSSLGLKISDIVPGAPVCILTLAGAMRMLL